MRKCEEDGISLFEFFIDIFSSYGAEGLFDRIYELCDEYGLPALDATDILKGYYEYRSDDDRYNVWKAFEYRLGVTSNR